jgi:hypothetical protein
MTVPAGPIKPWHTHLQIFRDSMRDSIRSYMTAAESYAAAIDTDPAAKQAFREEFPDFSPTFWARIEAVGRHQLDQRLLYGAHPAERHLRRLAYSEQKHALDHGVEVLVDGSEMLIHVDRLTPFQSKMVFGPTGIRDLAAQKAWLESEKLEHRRPPAADTGYDIRKGELVIHSPMRLGRTELLQILTRMETRS